MLKILSVLFLTSLTATEESKVDELLTASTEQVIETVEESRAYLVSKTKDIALDDAEPIECAQVAEDSDPVALVQHESPLDEVSSSVNALVEQQTGQLLVEEAVTDEVAMSENPEVEDLTLLIKQPAVTLAEPKSDKYDQLTISMEEKYKIANILNTMAENNVFKLLFEKKRLERLGLEVNHVHPVKFLGTVFSDPSLIHCMHKIRGSGFKWGGFIDGFSQRFAQEIHAGNVNAYLPGLAQHLHVSEAEIQRYINQQDIEGLIVFLMEKTSH